jgi:hypothetical protein
VLAIVMICCHLAVGCGCLLSRLPQPIAGVVIPSVVYVLYDTADISSTGVSAAFALLLLMMVRENRPKPTPTWWLT